MFILDNWPLTGDLIGELIVIFVFVVCLLFNLVDSFIWSFDLSLESGFFINFDFDFSQFDILGKLLEPYVKFKKLLDWFCCAVRSYNLTNFLASYSSLGLNTFWVFE